MIAELGHFALIVALFVALVQATVPLVGAHKGWSDWMRLAAPAAQVQFVAIAISFAALVYAFVVSDFSLQLVATNSNSAKPMIFKVSGTWANHEGSMLLWVLILALYGALVAIFSRNLPLTLKARVLAVQAMIGASFIAYVLFTSNPFLRLANPPIDGNGLNPLLQDIGLALHPPFLYLGYVGLSTAFSFAVAALIEGRVDAAWARWVRPWTLAAWVFLTIGIALGSWWAYYELGWGGWWFWDPVENASFMPWLISIALLHSAIVVEKRDTLKSWTVLLAILGFSFSLIGAFIVRSGILTSVHAFASDATRGLFLLLILAVTIGGALTLYSIRVPKLRSGAVFSNVSRESGLVINNLLLLVAMAVVFVGTMWPLVTEFITGNKISVGKPFFEITFTPFMVVLMMLVPLGAVLPWKRGNLRSGMRPLWGALTLSLTLGALFWSLQTGGKMLAPVGMALAAWLLLGSLADVAFRVRVGRAPIGESLRRARNLPRSDWGKTVAHSGLGLVVFAITALTAWQVEDIRSARPGDSFMVGGYQLTFERVEAVQGPNYTADRGIFTLGEPGPDAIILAPEKRLYPVERSPTTEAAIDNGLTRDVYIVLGDRQDDGSWAVRTYIKPFTMWLWLGTLVMAFGGVLSLSDRRYRVGAARQRKRPPAAAGVPAE